MRWSLNAGEGSRPAEDQALRALYERQADPLHSYVLRLLKGDLYRAEDIVQETLLRCWQHHELNDEAELLRPWLFRVAHNLVMDELRGRRTRTREVDSVEWLTDTHLESDGFDQILYGVVVGEALRKLSVPHREVLYLLYFQGLTTQEAAFFLGVPHGTVKSRAFYGLRMLKTMLRSRGSDVTEEKEQCEAA
ncbi:sigma-70 family RNA polymerase sigma factor [Streptomyces sp. NPDC102462]|uniref:sigma-70 family RNA polymerase sigma factor n=1 Tax=Streptomyces sp. NPDC102462 TaxID=3366178 RepID=UPI00380B9B44